MATALVWHGWPTCSTPSRSIAEAAARVGGGDGSNGKGSTAAFCASIAHAYRLRAGLFTSPHLHRFNERFQVDGVPIGDDDLARLKLRIEAAIAELSQRRIRKIRSL